VDGDMGGGLWSWRFQRFLARTGPAKLGLAFTGVLGATCAAGDFYLQNRHNGTKREFVYLSTEEALANELQTGDILLFNRTPFEFNPFKAAVVLLSKYISRSEYDSMGIVFKDSGDDYPYVLEYDFYGVKVTPFDERICFAREDDILLRTVKLPAATRKAKFTEIENYVEECRSFPKTGPIRIFVSLLSSLGSSVLPHQFSRVEVLGKLYELQAEITSSRQSIAASQKDSNAFNWDDPSLVGSLRKLKSQQALIQLVEKDRKSLQEKWDGGVVQQSACSVSPSTGLVVGALQILGVLPSEQSNFGAGSNSSIARDISSSARAQTSVSNEVPQWLADLPPPVPAEYLPCNFISPQSLPIQPGAAVFLEAFVIQKNTPVKYFDYDAPI